MEKAAPFIVLAGGQGRRLKSVVPNLPKPLAPVGDRPFLQHLIENLYAQGVRDLILSVHHQAHLIEAFVQNYTKPSGLSIRTVFEPRPLGTGGAVRFVMQSLRITTPCYVANGDTFMPRGYSDFRARQVPSASCDLIGLVRVPDVSRYGSVECDAVCKVLALKEKSVGEGGGWVNSGLYYLNPQSVDLPEADFSMENRVFPRLIQEGRLYGLRLETGFIDIGIPSDYHRFEVFLAEHKENEPC